MRVPLRPALWDRAARARRAAALLAAAAGASGCLLLGVGVTTRPVDDPREIVPKPFTGELAPPLEATAKTGLFRAPSLAPNLFYYEPESLWYRYAYRRWYQAFRWNGNWFILEDEPMVLREIELVRPKLPTLPELEGEEEEDPDDW